MPKNPYDILGIGRTADQKDIKSAYRRAAKKSHPDQNAPCPKTERFREIQEAYETLIDDHRRKMCDRELARMEAKNGHRTRRSGRPFRSPLAAETLRRPVEPLDTALFGQRSAGFAPLRLAMEIVLSPLEAKSGGRFPVRLPIDTVCPECRNTPPWVLVCPLCNGAGRLNRQLPFVLELPPGIENGSRAAVAIEAGGLGRGVLELRFRIDPQAA